MLSVGDLVILNVEKKYIAHTVDLRLVMDVSKSGRYVVVVKMTDDTVELFRAMPSRWYTLVSRYDRGVDDV